MEKQVVELNELFESEKEFLAECTRVSKFMEKIKRYKNHVLDDENKLYEVLKLDETISIYLEKLYVYSKFLSDLNLVSTKDSKNFAKVVSLYVKYASLASYLIPELLEKDFKFVKSYIDLNEKLEVYEKSLKNIYLNKRHVLSKDAENVLSVFTDSAKRYNDALTNLLHVETKFDEVNGEDLSVNNFEMFMMNNDRDIRKKAFITMYETLDKVSSTSASLLDGIISHNNKVSLVKKYKNALEMTLDKNNLDYGVYDNLIKNVKLNLNSFDKYWNLRNKLMGLKELKLYDISAPLSDGFEKEYSFAEARDLVLATCLNYGSEYSAKANKIFSENRIDAFPKNNKKEIAYTTSIYSDKSYVFLNYKNTFKDVSTLAHEMGHAVHFDYSKENNEFVNYEPSIFILEVASQVNELLLNKYMYKLAKSKEEKLMLLEDRLKDFEFVIRKATMYAEFEKIIHETNQSGVMLTSDYLDNEYFKLLKKYYKDNVVDLDMAKKDWIRMSGMLGKYYIYQYATGYIAALIIAEDIWDKNDDALDNYFKFLKLGKTVNPIKALKLVSVDIMNAKSYKKAFKIFDKTIDEFEELYYSKEEN